MARTKREAEAELRRVRKGQAAQSATAIITTFIRWGFLAYIFHQGALSVLALAGKQTGANINILGDFRISEALAWALTAGSLGWGSVERKLRVRKETQMGNRIKELEQWIDPKRSSSKLQEGQ